MNKICIIGGGASGLMAAYTASLNSDNEVILIEKNEKVGKKIYITGKGRCNITNNVEIADFLNNIVNNARFMMSSLNRFSPLDCIDFFESNNVKLKTERGNRVFPLSDKASDITRALELAIIKNKVKICLNEKVLDIFQLDGIITGVKTDKREIVCDRVIIATGGISYSQTGSTGDGYTFSKRLNHSIVTPLASLVGLNIKEELFKTAQGLTLKNIELSAYKNDKKIFSEFGELLITHFGISGPLVLSLSSKINRENLNDITLSLDLKPALSLEVLGNRILRDFEKIKNKAFKNALDELLPKSFIPIMIKLSNIDENKSVNMITSEERKNLVKLFKNVNMKIASLRPINEAIITSGGVSVKEINPKTMESKIVKGLFFAGEVIDVDALTGGFNLQIALSTGFVAGENV